MDKGKKEGCPAPTRGHYRSYRDKFLRVDPTNSIKSTEGR